MEKLRIGIIGYGQRAPGLMAQLVRMPEKVKITAVCDIFPDRIEAAQKKLREVYKLDWEPYGTTDAYELIDRDDVDAVIIAAAWEAHIPLSIYAMKAGKAVGCEVAGAYSIEQCWDLVKTYEETKTPIMMLENTLYARRERMLMHMAKEGFFGEIVHCDGAYCHYLCGEIADGYKTKHYRLRNYTNRNCDNYPTHEIGPIARVLNINNGNRFVSLSSFASKAAGLEHFIKEERADVEELKDIRPRQGDIVTSVLTCAGGQTVTIRLGTTLPRYYSREFNIHGTKAFYNNDKDFFVDSTNINDVHETGGYSITNSNAAEYEEKWLDPLWRQYLEEGVKGGGVGMAGGHNGTDWLCMSAFVDAVINKEPMPIDVYDMAIWMAITPLTEASIANGGTPVEFPDFTNGRWLYDKAF